MILEVIEGTCMYVCTCSTYAYLVRIEKRKTCARNPGIQESKNHHLLLCSRSHSFLTLSSLFPLSFLSLSSLFPLSLHHKYLLYNILLLRQKMEGRQADCKERGIQSHGSITQKNATFFCAKYKSTQCTWCCWTI